MLTVSRSSSQYHHGDLATALERATVEILAETGKPGVSLRAVARRAGVSHNAPYHHFGDRQGLLKAAAATGLREMLDTMTAARNATDDPRDQLLRVGFAYAEYAAAHPALFEIIFDPEVCDPREPNPVTGPLAEANDEFLTDTVRGALSPGAAEDRVRATAAALWGAVHGLAILVANGHLPGDVVRPGLESLLDLRLPGAPPDRVEE